MDHRPHALAPGAGLADAAEGDESIRQAFEPLITTVPVKSLSARVSARSMSRVKMPAWSMPSIEFASGIASPSESTATTAMIGPKTSRRITAISGVTPASSVGVITPPSRSPPVTTSAPRSRASSSISQTRSAAAS